MRPMIPGKLHFYWTKQSLGAFHLHTGAERRCCDLYTLDSAPLSAAWRRSLTIVGLGQGRAPARRSVQDLAQPEGLVRRATRSRVGAAALRRGLQPAALRGEFGERRVVVRVGGGPARAGPATAGAAEPAAALWRARPDIGSRRSFGWRGREVGGGVSCLRSCSLTCARSRLRRGESVALCGCRDFSKGCGICSVHMRMTLLYEQIWRFQVDHHSDWIVFTPLRGQAQLALRQTFWCRAAHVWTRCRHLLQLDLTHNLLPIRR
mmetsp:Transcript_17005/g.48588  ORF Transcript_17005/g.48588 Transcript_17005/m.48588 type:complete len:263 (-) Transcript_17005:2828-3616(-)